jgi:hypothetical protein
MLPCKRFYWLTGLTIPTSSSVVIEQLEARMWLTDTSVGSQVHIQQLEKQFSPATCFLELMEQVGHPSFLKLLE